jgi:hypothetical protein
MFHGIPAKIARTILCMTSQGVHAVSHGMAEDRMPPTGPNTATCPKRTRLHAAGNESSPGLHSTRWQTTFENVYPDADFPMPC